MVPLQKSKAGIALHITPMALRLFVGAILCCGELSCDIAWAEEPFRVWTSRSGRQLEARFLLRSGNEQVHLTTRDGQVLSIANGMLTDADQQYLMGRALRNEATRASVSLPRYRRYNPITKRVEDYVPAIPTVNPASNDKSDTLNRFRSNLQENQIRARRDAEVRPHHYGVSANVAGSGPRINTARNGEYHGHLYRHDSAHRFLPTEESTPSSKVYSVRWAPLPKKKSDRRFWMSHQEHRAQQIAERRNISVDEARRTQEFERGSVWLTDTPPTVEQMQIYDSYLNSLPP